MKIMNSGLVMALIVLALGVAEAPAQVPIPRPPGERGADDPCAAVDALYWKMFRAEGVMLKATKNDSELLSKLRYELYRSTFTKENIAAVSSCWRDTLYVSPGSSEPPSIALGLMRSDDTSTYDKKVRERIIDVIKAQGIRMEVYELQERIDYMNHRGMASNYEALTKDMRAYIEEQYRLITLLTQQTETVSKMHLRPPAAPSGKY